MQALIAGCGAIGFRAATYLSERGSRVTLIDEDKSRCDWVSKNVDATVYNGSILDPAILMDAGIDKADLLLTALGDDQVTVKLIDFAKSQFGVPRVIAVAKSSEAVMRVRESGADAVICSEDAVVNEIENMIQTNGHKTIYKDRQKDFEITRVSVKATSRLLGKETSSIESKDAKISAILRGDRLVMTQDSQLQMGDELFLVGKKDSLAKLIDELGQE